MGQRWRWQTGAHVADDGVAALQRQHGRDDAPACDLPACRVGSGGQGFGDGSVVQSRHGAGDETLAQIADVADGAGRAAGDARIVEIDGVGDDGGRRVGRRRARGEHGDRIGDAEREAAPAPARGGDAAHGGSAVDDEATIRRQAGEAVCRVIDEADVELRPRCEMQGDVAAVVDVGAVDAGVVEAADQALGNAAGNGRHRRDEAAALGMAATGGDHASRDRATRRHACAIGRRQVETQRRQLCDELVEHATKAFPGAFDACGRGTRFAFGRENAIDRAVLEVPAAVGELRAHRATHAGTPVSASSGQGLPCAGSTTWYALDASTSWSDRTRSMWPPSAR